MGRHHYLLVVSVIAIAHVWTIKSFEARVGARCDCQGLNGMSSAIYSCSENGSHLCTIAARCKTDSDFLASSTCVHHQRKEFTRVSWPHRMTLAEVIISSSKTPLYGPGGFTKWNIWPDVQNFRLHHQIYSRNIHLPVCVVNYNSLWKVLKTFGCIIKYILLVNALPLLDLAISHILSLQRNTLPKTTHAQVFGGN